MVSRKKIKGRARKAAKAEAAHGPLFLLLQQLRRRQTNTAGCTHGWNPTEYPVDHDCNAFIETALEALKEGKRVSATGTKTVTSVKLAIGITHTKYPEVMKDPASLEWIAAAFVSIGTEAIANDEDHFYCTSVIGFSESLRQWLACNLRQTQPFKHLAKIHDLSDADKRRVISYTKKRIPCSCLDEEYKKVKSLPRTGLCSNYSCRFPGGRIALNAMMSCEKCRKEHYCSEACQAAHWEDVHNEKCKLWRMWQDIAN